MIRRPPRSTQSRSSAASDVYKRQSCVDTTRPPKLNHGLAALLMSEVPCILALRAVGQNQVVAGSSQQTGGGLVNLLDRQRCLIGSIIEIRHLTVRPQSLQDPAEPWRAVRIRCSASVSYTHLRAHETRHD